jgi:transcription termination factor Rho
MSVEPTTLERSALERKDREELTTIAQALGAKPPSRARKAEIVQLILELTGVEPRSAEASSTPRPARSRAGNGRTKEAPVDDSDDATPPPEPAATDATTASEGDAATSAAPAATAPSATETSPAEASPTEPSGTSPGRRRGARAATSAAGGDADTKTATDWDDEFGGTTDVPAGSAPAATDGPSNPASSAQAQGGSGDRGETRPDAKGGTRPQDGRPGDGRPGDSASRGDQPRGDVKQGDRQGDAKQGDAKQGDRQGGDQNRGDTPDANEPGNRRRRRRGRRGKDDQSQAEDFTGEPLDVEGLLDLRDEGYGFLRVKGYLPSKDDIYVSVKQARQFGLRKGDRIAGASRPAMRNEKNPALLRIDKVNGDEPDKARQRRRFEDLTPLFPDEKLSLETTNDPSNMTARIVDLIAPVGKGQRGLIVSPPKAGKTAIVKQIARSVETNNPEVKLMVLLVDERPEEVTDMRRWLRNDTSEVVASTFDRPSEEHTQVAELTIERAKRLVEDGQDVCIILDGITRLARAYNLAAPATGRIMSGGVDSGALYPPKRFFGAARNIEEGGSLTILATALIETGSKMDEVIFEEFKGTGNMELRLDRRLAERRVYPAIDVDASSTRHEELLFARNQLNLVWALRRVLSGLSHSDGGNAAALELLIDRMKTFRTNDEFLAEVAKNRLAAG